MESKIPINMSEAEVMAVINNVANRLARKFRFGYHEVEDMKQQARLFAWEGISKYDGQRPLENFLWTHVRNRLFNFKRDKYERPGKPCVDCQYYIYDGDGDRCTKFDDKTECDLYKKWINRNERKKNLMNPIDLNITNSNSEYEMKIYDTVDSDIDYQALLVIVEKELPVVYRSLYLRLKNGTKLSKVQRTKIQEIIQQILINNGYTNERS